MAFYAKHFKEVWDGLLSNPCTPSIIGNILLVFPFAKFEWIPIDFGWRQIPRLIGKIGFANYSIFEWSRQRSTLSSTTPYTTRFEGGSISFLEDHRPSPPFSGTLTREVWPCISRSPSSFVPMLYILLLDQLQHKILLPSLLCSHQLGAPKVRSIVPLPLTPDQCRPEEPSLRPSNLNGIASPDPIPVGIRDHLDPSNRRPPPDNGPLCNLDPPPTLLPDIPLYWVSLFGLGC